MNHNITLLIELRDKYIKVLELKNRDYCIINNLQFGLCNAAMYHGNCKGFVGDLLLKLRLLKLISKTTELYFSSYYWPVYLYTKNIDMSLTPRLEALNIMIKYLTDEKDITKD